jgi:amidohydrolase
MNFLAELTRHRRALHQIPEMGFEEHKTRAYIIGALEKMGLEAETVAETGVLVTIKGDRPGPVIGLRSDMDGLSVHEQTDRSFASVHDGFMHACGHDGHMATLLVLAEDLMERRDQLSGTVVLVFQPAEEGPGGAEVIEASGRLTELGVEEMLGLHLMPDLPLGTVGVKSGPLMAMTGEFDIEIQGTGAHGAKPHLGKDALLAASDLLMGLQHIVSRRVDPLEPAVITVGTMSGGERRNIIAARARLEGTLRAFDEGLFHEMKGAIEASGRAIGERYGVAVNTVFRDMYPPVVNDATMTERFETALGDRIRRIPSSMLAEDFSYYQKERPGLFFFVGTEDGSKGAPLHSGHFDFDESALLTGLDAYRAYLVARGLLADGEIDHERS